MFRTNYASIIRSTLQYTVSRSQYIRAGESSCYVVVGRTNVPTARYSLLDSAPDDGSVVRPKHVQQVKTVK